MISEYFGFTPCIAIFLYNLILSAKDSSQVVALSFRNTFHMLAMVGSSAPFFKVTLTKWLPWMCVVVRIRISIPSGGSSLCGKKKLDFVPVKGVR